MRIAVDTNILFSAIYRPGKSIDLLLRALAENHTIVITRTIVDEFLGVINRNNSEGLFNADMLLASFPFEYIYTPENIIPNLFEIRDPKDYKILYSVLVSNVDVFITGDKDFFDVIIESPEICSPHDFISKYMS